MLQLTIACLVIALILAVVGFGGLAGTFMGVAKILFVVFLILAVISFVGGGMREDATGGNSQRTIAESKPTGRLPLRNRRAIPAGSVGETFTSHGTATRSCVANRRGSAIEKAEIPMKTFLVGLFALTLVAAVGCTNSSPETSKATATAEPQAKPTTTVAKPTATVAEPTTIVAKNRLPARRTKHSA